MTNLPTKLKSLTSPVTKIWKAYEIITFDGAPTPYEFILAVIVTMILSCTVSQIQRDIGRKSPTLTPPPSLWRPVWSPCSNIKILAAPAWGRGTPFPAFFLRCSLTSSSFALLYFSPFPFLLYFTYSLLSSFPSHSTRIVNTPFPGRRS